MTASALRYDPASAFDQQPSDLQTADDQMAEAELLDRLLCLCGPQNADTLPRAEHLLARMGSLSAILTASLEALQLVGMDAGTASRLRLLQTLFGQLARRSLDRRPIINSWNALLGYVRVALRDDRREQFHVLFLDRRLRLIRDEHLGSGTVDHAPVYPREVVRRALELSASAIILVHNHPSGDPTPSRADIEITRTIADGGRLLGIVVHDHLIVGASEVTSFKSLGLI